MAATKTPAVALRLGRTTSQIRYVPAIPIALILYRAQFTDALQLIGPKPERLAECKHELARAMLACRGLKILDKALTPAVKRKRMLQQVKKLRAVEVSIWNERLIREVKRERAKLENEADKIVVRQGSPRKRKSKHRAVLRAHDLLADFGVRPPGLSRDGPWHRLATILLGNLDADLFEYLRDYRSPGRPRRPRRRA